MAHKTRRRRIAKQRRERDLHEPRVRAAMRTLARLKKEDPDNLKRCAGVAITGGRKGELVEILAW